MIVWLFVALYVAAGVVQNIRMHVNVNVTGDKLIGTFVEEVLLFVIVVPFWPLWVLMRLY